MRTIELPNEIIIPEIKRLLDEGRTTTFRVKGRSMRIFLADGRDQVLLKRLPDVSLHDVVLAEIAPKHYVLHRVIQISGERLVLQGDGNVRGVEHCTKADVIGTALGFYRKGRTTLDRTDSLKWRLYSRLWLLLTPLRRYILFIHRQLFGLT